MMSIHPPPNPPRVHMSMSCSRGGCRARRTTHSASRQHGYDGDGEVHPKGEHQRRVKVWEGGREGGGWCIKKSAHQEVKYLNSGRQHTLMDLMDLLMDWLIDCRIFTNPPGRNNSGVLLRWTYVNSIRGEENKNKKLSRTDLHAFFLILRSCKCTYWGWCPSQ